MEICPKCNYRILVYDLHTKSARCLSSECQYRERMDREQYTERFERGDENLAYGLPFPRNFTITSL
jgi:hypothetical protein